MKKIIKKTLACAAVAILVFSQTVAGARSACEGSGKTGKHGEEKLEKLADELNLTTEQQEGLKAQRNESREKMKQPEIR